MNHLITFRTTVATEESKSGRSKHLQSQTYKLELKNSQNLPFSVYLHVWFRPFLNFRIIKFSVVYTILANDGWFNISY